MKVYNKEKNRELEKYDLSLGYLQDDKLIIHHDLIEGQNEEGHYETVREYDNGGKDVEWIIDKPYIEHKDAWDETIPIKVYVEFTEFELSKINLEKQIEQIKNILNETDYLTLKYIDGAITEDEYQPIKEYRQQLRVDINGLEIQLNNLINNENGG